MNQLNLFLISNQGCITLSKYTLYAFKCFGSHIHRGIIIVCGGQMFVAFGGNSYLRINIPTNEYTSICLTFIKIIPNLLPRKLRHQESRMFSLPTNFDSNEWDRFCSNVFWRHVIYLGSSRVYGNLSPSYQPIQSRVPSCLGNYNVFRLTCLFYLFCLILSMCD